jgi:hypothetical protein
VCLTISGNSIERKKPLHLTRHVVEPLQFKITNACGGGGRECEDFSLSNEKCVFLSVFLPLIDFFSYNKSPPPYFIPFLRIHYAVEGKVILTGS